MGYFEKLHFLALITKVKISHQNVGVASPESRGYQGHVPDGLRAVRRRVRGRQRVVRGFLVVKHRRDFTIVGRV